MSQRIALDFGVHTIEAELNESAASRELAASLPLEISMSRWGDEYYGALPSALRSAGALREVMEVGEIAYWPPGRALCIFFGPTPASEGEEPRAASPVVPLGRAVDDPTTLRALSQSVRVRVSLAGRAESQKSASNNKK